MWNNPGSDKTGIECSGALAPRLDYQPGSWLAVVFFLFGRLGPLSFQKNRQESGENWQAAKIIILFYLVSPSITHHDDNQQLRYKKYN